LLHLAVAHAAFHDHALPERTSRVDGETVACSAVEEVVSRATTITSPGSGRRLYIANVMPLRITRSNPQRSDAMAAEVRIHREIGIVADVVSYAQQSAEAVL